MRRLSVLPFMLTGLLVPDSGLCAQKTRASARTPGSLPPSITCDLAPETVVDHGEELRFHVRARDPDGRTVNLTLLDPTPGIAFDPLVRARSPATAEVRWRFGNEPGGRVTLVFEARDELGHCARLTRSILFTEAHSTNVHSADVTGDGVLDVVAAATKADVGAASNTGALYVWAGASSPSGAPTASLTIASAHGFEELGDLGYAPGEALTFADVSGDGVDDIVCLAHGAGGGDGALYVFAGGSALAGAVAPRAVLNAPDAGGVGDAYQGQGILAGDVTGDGVLDVVAGAVYATVNGVRSGALYVWAGGAGLAGSVLPTAILSVPGAAQHDFLCMSDGQGLLLGDVTGDGVLDVVAAARYADVGGIPDKGAVYVWAGGSVLGTAPPVTFTAPGDARILRQRGEQALRLADVTGDGVLDVLAGDDEATIAAKAGAGAVYVFQGGGPLAGTLGPRAILCNQAGAVDDRLGADRGAGFRVADVTGDGLLEVVAPALRADFGGVADVGVVHVFSVAGKAGLVSPRATLAVPGAVSGDTLGYAGGAGLELVDVTGDGVLDFVVNSTVATIGGVYRSGALYVFAGGDLRGTIAPLATLSVPGAVAEDMLGDALASRGFTCVDLTGDGTLDILASTDQADVAGVRDTGAVYLFAGDGGFAGARAPSATLTVPGARAGDQLGFVGLDVGDVTGDGKLDVVAGARLASLGGVSTTGAIHLFASANGFTGALAPSATLTVPQLSANDYLDVCLLADVTGDGVLDVVGDAYADVNGVIDAGALYVYAGGAMTGTVWPSATLTVPGALPHDPMYFGFVADVTGDGVPDLLGRSPLANVGVIVDAGALYLWRGGSPQLRGSPAPLRLAVPGARRDDELGS